MAKYAHIQNSDDSILKVVDYDNFDAAAVAHKFGADKAVRIIPVVVLADPTISDPATERLGPYQNTVQATEVQRQRTVVAIPQEEQDAKTELDQIKAVANDIRDGVGTATQRLQRLERAVFRILKDQYGS